MKILAFIGILLLIILSLIIFALILISVTKFCIVFELLKIDGKQEVFVTLSFWKNLVSIPILKKITPDGKEKKDKKKKKSSQKGNTSKEDEATSFIQTIKNYTDLYHALKPSALKGLRRIKDHTSLDPFKLYVNFGAKDPATTGMIYGALEAVIRPFMAVLDEVTNIAPPDLKLNPDFNNQRFDLYLSGIIRLRFVHIITALISIYYVYRRHIFKTRKKS